MDIHFWGMNLAKINCVSVAPVLEELKDELRPTIQVNEAGRNRSKQSTNDSKLGKARRGSKRKVQERGGRKWSAQLKGRPDHRKGRVGKRASAGRGRNDAEDE